MQSHAKTHLPWHVAVVGVTVLSAGGMARFCICGVLELPTSLAMLGALIITCRVMPTLNLICMYQV